MFGLGYVDPALIRDVLKRADLSRSITDISSKNRLLHEAGTVSGNQEGGGRNDQSRIDNMLDDIAQQLPISPGSHAPIRQREADFWLRFDPDGIGRFWTAIGMMGPSFLRGEGVGWPWEALAQASTAGEREAKRQYPGERMHNSRGDTFRHVYASSVLASLLGPDRAKELTDAHERSNPNEIGERYGDLFANWFGIAIEGHPGFEGHDRAEIVKRAIELGLIPQGRLPVR